MQVITLDNVVTGNYGRLHLVLELMRRKTSVWYRLQGLHRLLTSRDTSDRSIGTLLSVGTMAVVFSIHAMLPYLAVLEALYLVPAWFVYRNRGRLAGSMMLVLSAAVATAIAPGGPTFAGLMTRLAVYGMVGLAVGLATPEVAPAPEEDWLPKRLHSWGLGSRAVAVNIDCEGFNALDEYYGEGSGDHISSMLVRILNNETRQSDLVAKVTGSSYVLVIPEATSEQAAAIMERVRGRFVQMVSDAGYECSINFGCSVVETEPKTLQQILNEIEPNHRAYLN